MISIWIKDFINIFFALGLFFNALLFIPQAIKIYKSKDSTELSLLTFAGFNVMQLFAVLHGYLVKDYILMLGFLLSFLTGTVVSLLILIFRKNKRSNLVKKTFSLGGKL